MIKVLFLCLLLPACGCKVSVGDRVLHGESSRMGEVVAIQSLGSWTNQCDIAVRFDDRAVVYWVKGFEFELIEDKGEK